MAPETLSDGTAKNQVRRRLSGALAQLVHIRVQGVLLLQVGIALYAVLEEQPGKELDLRGGMVRGRT